MRINYLVLVVLLLLFTNNLFGQKIKYGYINFEKVLAEMPEIKKANNDLQLFLKQINSHIEAKTAEYKSKLEEFKKNEKQYNPLVLNDKQNELNKLANGIKEFQENAQRDINKKKDELYKSAIVKLNKAIQEVANEQALRFVLNEVSLLYKKDADDIGDLVRKKLGISKNSPNK